MSSQLPGAPRPERKWAWDAAIQNGRPVAQVSVGNSLPSSSVLIAATMFMACNDPPGLSAHCRNPFWLDRFDDHCLT